MSWQEPHGGAWIAAHALAGRGDGRGCSSHAPEVIDAATGRGRVDYSGQAVYELGVLLWEMVSGTHPLPGYPGTIVLLKCRGLCIFAADQF